MKAIKPNPLRDLFDPERKAAPLSDFDWAGTGLSKRYLIIFMPRSGSTLLSNLIKSVQRCGTPDEFMSNGYVKAQFEKHGQQDMRGYLQFLIKQHTRNGIWGAEIDSLRLRLLHEVLDFGAVFPGEQTPYVWLTRKDLIAQAYSSVAARNSGLWHKFEGGGEARLENPQYKDKRIDDEQLTQQIIRFAQAEVDTNAFFQRLGVAPFTLYYEELVADKSLTLMRLLRHIGVSIEGLDLQGLNANPTHRMTYDDKNEFLMGYEQRNPMLASYLRSNRHMLDISKLKSLI